MRDKECSFFLRVWNRQIVLTSIGTRGAVPVWTTLPGSLHLDIVTVQPVPSGRDHQLHEHAHLFVARHGQQGRVAGLSLDNDRGKGLAVGLCLCVQAIHTRKKVAFIEPCEPSRRARRANKGKNKNMNDKLLLKTLKYGHI